MRRNRPDVKSRPTFAIVVDGDCEVWYLQMLKRNERSSLVVNISPQIPQRKSITDQFKTVRQFSPDYTKVFWVIDFDVVIRQTNAAKKGEKTPLQYFLEHRKEIDKDYKNVVIVINNPCLEFWFLLHFEETAKYFDDCSKAEERLKKYLTDYEKTEKFFVKNDGQDIYSKLRPNLKAAVANAKKLKKFDPENLMVGLTEMYLFFEAAEFDGHFVK